MNLIPEGTYKAKATDCALGLTARGTEQVAVELELLEGDAANSKITWYGHFTEKTLESDVKALRACGWIGDDLSDLRGVGDKEVLVVIQHQPDRDGNVRARVRWINTIGGLALKTRLDTAQARAFGARMRGQIAALGLSANGAAKKEPSASPQARTPEQQRSDDEEMPF